MDFKVMARSVNKHNQAHAINLLDRVWLQVCTDEPLDVDVIDDVLTKLKIVRRLVDSDYSERGHCIREEAAELTRQIQ